MQKEYKAKSYGLDLWNIFYFSTFPYLENKEFRLEGL